MDSIFTISRAVAMINIMCLMAKTFVQVQLFINFLFYTSDIREWGIRTQDLKE